MDTGNEKYITAELIAEITQVVTQPYGEWVIGTGGQIEHERHINVMIFETHNTTSVTEAYQHFTALGMVAKPNAGTQYLYIFKIGGARFPHWNSHEQV